MGMNREVDPLVDREWLNAIWDYVTDKDGKEKAAADRHVDIVRVHREGWKNVAEAIKTGLAAVVALSPPQRPGRRRRTG